MDIYLFLFLFPCVCLSQTADTIATDAVFQRAKTFQQTGSYDSALFYYRHLIEIDTTDNKRLGDIYLSMGDCMYYAYRDLPASIDFYQRALEVRKRVYPATHQSISEAHNYLFYCYYEMGEYDQTKKHLLKGFFIDSLRYEHQPDSNAATDLAATYTNMGSFFGQLGDYDRQLTYSLKGLDYILKSGQDKEYHIYYNNVAAAYWGLWENERAKAYILQAIGLELLKYPDSISLGIARGLSNLAPILGQEKAYQKQFETLLAAEKILNQIAPEDLDLGLMGTIYSNLGRSCQNLDRLDLSLHYLNKSLEIAQKMNNPIFEASVLVNKGGLAYKHRAFSKTRAWIDQANQLLIEHFGEQHPLLAQNLITQGKCFQLEGKWAEALASYRQAISANQHAFLTFKMSDDDLFEGFFSVNHLYALHGIGSTLFEQYQETANSALLQEAMQIYNELKIRNSALRKSIAHKSAKQSIQASLTNAYETGMSVAWELYQQTQDPFYLDEIFSFFQTQKALSLFENLQDRRARYFSDIPDRVIQEEADIKRAISFYKSKLEAVNATQLVDQALINSWNEKLLKLQQDYEQFILDLERLFPRYHALKYKTEVLSLVQAQALLTDEEGMIEYFMGDSAVFVLAIFHDTVLFRSFEKEGLYERVIACKDAMEREHKPQSYPHLANDLYKRLLAPELQGRKAGALVIIPDGFLHYLSFETLITEMPTVSQKYGDLPYLLLKHPISYAAAAALLDASLEMPAFANSKGIMAIAPVFDGEGKYYPDQGVIPQFNSLQFISELLQWIKGKAFIREAAQEDIFKQEVHKYQVLQLSTHAFVNDSLPMRSYFMLAKPLDEKSKTEDGYVYTYEVYDTKIKAELAVLMGCKTGFGKVQAGEGVISLARAFQYAGCSSILMSLWSIDEIATNDVLGSFYQALKKGKSKRDALHEAKIDFLSKHANDELSNPYYWGGLTLLGDYGPIDLEEPSSSMPLIFAILFACLGLGLSWGWMHRNKG